MRVPGILVLAGALVACSGSPTGDAGECYLPLGGYCGMAACPSYEQSLAELQQAAGASCFTAQAGSCGSLRFTRYGPWFGNTTRYYDASGGIVAVHETTDVYQQSTCPGWKHYGERLSCHEVVLQDYCRR